MAATNPYIYPIDYTSRDYLSLREELLNVLRSRVPEWDGSDPADMGVALVEAFAYVGDVLGYYIDRVAQETFLASASQRQSLLNIASVLGYAPAGRVAAKVLLELTNADDADATLPAGYQVATTVRVGEVSTQIVFELDEEVTVPANGSLDNVAATEGQTLVRVIGTSGGYAGQEFLIRDYPIIDRSVSLSIGSTTYTYIENLFNAGPDAAVFTYRTDEFGLTTVTLGDGVSGLVPPEGQTVTATFRVGGGSDGNIAAEQFFTSLSTPSFPGTITNPSAGAGGIDEETNEEIRRNALAAFRTRVRAVSKQDFADLALNDTRISKARARGNAYSSMRVYVAPNASVNQATNPAPAYDAYLVSTKGVASNVATLTLTSAPALTVGDAVVIGGVGAPFDGTFTLTAVDEEDKTISYSLTTSNVTTTNCTGVVQGADDVAFAAVRDEIKDYLEEVSPAGTVVQVLPPRYRDVYAYMTIGVREGVRKSDASAAVRSAMLGALSYSKSQFGDTLRASSLTSYLVTLVPLINYVTVDVLKRTDTAGDVVETIQLESDELVRLLDKNLVISVDPATGVDA